MGLVNLGQIVCPLKKMENTPRGERKIVAPFIILEKGSFANIFRKNARLSHKIPRSSFETLLNLFRMNYL